MIVGADARSATHPSLAPDGWLSLWPFSAASSRLNSRGNESERARARERARESETETERERDRERERERERERDLGFRGMSRRMSLPPI